MSGAVLGALVVVAGLATVVPALAADGQTTFPVKLGDRVEQRRALVCAPKGPGPFPVVVFNHGSIVDGWGWPGAAQRGYRLDRVCDALARDGYVAFAPIREPAPRGRGFQDYDESYAAVVQQAIDHVKTRPEADPSRVALAGFSMGGLVSFAVALRRDDLRAVALLAPAAGRGRLAEVATGTAGLSAPTLVLVAADDAPYILHGVGVLDETARAHGKPLRIVRFERGGGHELFYDVGHWWADFTRFLGEHLAPR